MKLEDLLNNLPTSKAIANNMVQAVSQSARSYGIVNHEIPIDCFHNCTCANKNIGTINNPM
jgi:hypothetical protein